MYLPPTRAVVLRRTRFSESSLVLTLFTRELGRVDALAKGCRRPRNRMYGHFDLLCLEEVVLCERSRSNLDLVTDGHILREFRSLSRCAASFAAACLLADILLQTCMPRDPHPRIFDHLLTALEDFGAGQPPAQVLLRTLPPVCAALGFAPRLGACSACGREASRAPRVTLCAGKGGILCHDCAPASRRRWLSPRDLAMLSCLFEGGTRAARLSLAGAEIDELLRLTLDYIQHVAGKGLRSRQACASLLGIRPGSPAPAA